MDYALIFITVGLGLTAGSIKWFGVRFPPSSPPQKKPGILLNESILSPKGLGNNMISILKQLDAKKGELSGLEV